MAVLMPYTSICCPVCGARRVISHDHGSPRIAPTPCPHHPKGPRVPSYGQYQVAEPHSAMARVHLHKGEPLKEVDHEPKAGVLDQQSLFRQGIDTSKLVAGARRVDALGSCTANANAVAASNIMSEEEYLTLTGATSYADVKAIECFAIKFYAKCSHLTGDPAQEWPPTDCGSSGPYIVAEDQRLGIASGDRIAHGAQNLVSLLQTDGVLEGGPFLNAWEVPPPGAVVDGNGTLSALEDQVALGVAGGHETYISAIVKLTLTETGVVVPEKTLLRVRNSWDNTWGDHGSFYIHLSTLVALGRYFDFRQLTPRAV